MKYLVENPDSYEVLTRYLPSVPETVLKDSGAESFWDFLHLIESWNFSVEFDLELVKEIDKELKKLNIRVEQSVSSN